MNRNLLGNLEDETPIVLVGHGYKKQGRGMLGLFLVAFFALFLNGKAVAQTDYSGIYYIASGGKSQANGNSYTYNSSTPSNNFYLCPTEGWCFYQATNDFTGTDNGQPFFTTFKCRTNDYHSGDPSDAIWTIEKAPEPNSNYYYIKQTGTGKYMLSNGQIRTSTNADRIRVHLEAVTGDLDDKALFAIEPVSGQSYVVIRIVSTEGINGTHKWLSVCYGNYNNLVGNSGKNGGPTGYVDVAGTVCIYTQDDTNAPFYLEDAVQLPVISQAPNGDISITCATNNTTIYYTLDGSTPVVPADGAPDPTGPTYKYTGTFTPALGCEGIKAVAVLSNLHAAVSKMAELSFSAYSMPTISFNGIDQVTISASHSDATIYYTTDGSDPIVGTSSIYSTPLTVTDATTVKAIATHTGYLTSDMATLVITQVATPTIQNNGNNAISITSATPGATIYYTTDGSTPTTSSTEYTGPLTENVSGVTIKAIAVKENMITSAVGSGSVTLQCAAPVIVRNGTTGFIATCSFPTSGVTIYYTTGDGTQADPTTLSSSIPSGGTVNIELPTTVKAMAVATNYNNSTVTTTIVTQGVGGAGTEADPYTIEYQSDVSDFISKANTPGEASKYYKVIAASPLDFSEASDITQPFSGTFDGNGQTLTGLTHPLFETIDGGTVKNVMLKEVAIESSVDTLGAIACKALGYTRIYNCGILPNTSDFPNGTHPIVSTSGNCAGSLVGSLRDDSRVVNCFSYADVIASSSAAGIVGYNQYESDATETNGKYADLRTMVVNCMYYGDITSPEIYPIYGGKIITNAGNSMDPANTTNHPINNYNFYSDGCSFSSNIASHYHCSWPARYDYLTQYEYHRYLLNSNRELCGWWVGAPQAPSTMAVTAVQAVPKDASLMAKWVLDPNVAPFPILKPFGKYTSPINIDADAPWRQAAANWEGKNLGTLKVNIYPGDHAATGVNNTTKYITITDMDTLRGDYCYRKIQLPYYNSTFGNPDSDVWSEKYAGNYDEYVVTGWEITSVVGGSAGTFEPHWEHGYNFADRNCTAKDMYDVSGRVFAQGGFYYVPNGVSEITIKAHWGKAYYLGNGDDANYYDRVDFDHLTDRQGNTDVVLRANHAGSAFAPAGTRPTTLPNGRPVLTGKLATVAGSCIHTAESVYDIAIVLVGNHQYCTGKEDVRVNSSNTNPYGFTIMSADFDCDDEPDYCLEWQLGQGTTRQNICPIRFDFLPVVEMGLCLKKDGSDQYYSLGCYHPLGHFEVTETALIRFGQFEFGSNVRTKVDPLILNGGVYDQYVKGKESSAATNDDINYVIIGGKVYLPSFTPGDHVAMHYATRHCAVNAIGGKFDYFYLTGNYNETVDPHDDNPHCYIDGGWFDQVAAAGKEGIDGNVTFKINHAVIHEFYGGSTMDRSNMVVKGDIDVTVDNSIVNKYCGGPKFGDMVAGKKVKTEATNTIFGVFYGAGNGGTNYVQYQNTDGTYKQPNAFNWESTGKLNQYHPGQYYTDNTVGLKGYKANYEMSMINVSTGTYTGQAVIRTYFFTAQYAATNTGEVENTLDSCIVLGNFYGAGNLGGVNGNVTSKLTDTEVRGSAFGAGYSASIPKVKIYEKDKLPPVIDLETGYITLQQEGTYNEYTWTHDPSLNTSNPIGVINGKPCFYTEISLDSLGTVHGNVTLTIEGKSTIGSYVNGVLKPDSGNVFGGGDESLVTGNTEVFIKDYTKVFGNIYGGGNMGKVAGDTKVIINGVVPETNSGTTPGGPGGE